MSKYRNKKTLLDGIWFDSKKEAGRYAELKILEKAREITGLELQPKYQLVAGDTPLRIVSKGYPNGRKLTYSADFQYFDSDGRRVIEDVKGMKTDVYKIKKAIMHAMGYVITEI